MSVIQVKRGDIHYANLDPVVGRETGKTRPVLVIQNDIGNMYSPTTIVAVITEYSERKASYPICVAIKKGNGLKKDSIVNLSQIRTIDKNRLIIPKLGTLPNDFMKKVDKAIMNSLALS
jgi:mRNA interferase MazF